MAEAKKRVMGIDWGGKRLGLAISDETRTLARPLSVIQHTSRQENAQKILNLALQEDVGLIIIGVTYSPDGALSPSGRSAVRLKEEIEKQADIPIIVFDEADSTNQAKDNQIIMGSTRKKRRGHLDAHAAAIILHAYLNEVKTNE